MKVSACWITKNEENNILRSINSVKEAVDELIVVDTGSVDNTVKIAEEAGATTDHFEWINDFAAARNYALELIGGEITFFLDADEWFEPALSAADRKEIESIFINNPMIHGVYLTLNNLDEQGSIKSKAAQFRIMRNDVSLRYYGSIHETVLYDGGPPKSYTYENRQLIHNGYAEDVLDFKMARNIELLEASVIIEKDPERRHKFRCYLAREYHLINSRDMALYNLKLVLKEPGMLRKHLLFSGHSFVNLLYYMLAIASENRDSVSRREIKRKIVDTIKDNLPTYPGVATIDLYFEKFFDLKESRLLNEIGGALTAAVKMPGSPYTTYKEAEAEIESQAAKAEFRRGNNANAMEYAIKVFKSANTQSQEVLRLLLNCLRGQKTTDIALFLNSQFNVKDHRTLKFLVSGTYIHGFRDLHAYYLDKCSKEGLATKGDYLYLLILYGKYEEAVEIAKGINDKTNGEAVRQTITVAAVCSGDERFFYENMGLIGKYADILNAYFSKTPLESISDEHGEILGGIYPLIALAAGVERADEFADIFSSEKSIVYLTRVNYYMENGLYELVLSIETPDDSNYLCRLLTIQALTMLGRLEEAFGLTKDLLETGDVEETILLNLSAIADRAAPPLMAAARSLYERYMSVYDVMIDLRDILNTGYAPDDNDKKKTRTLRALTLPQFESQLKENTDNARINGLRDTCLRAATFFEDKSMFSSSIECLMLGLADCTEQRNEIEIYEHMSRLFQKIGNPALASEIQRYKK